MKRKLTTKFVDSIKPAPKGTRVDHWDTVLTGFGVRVNDKGRKSFIVGVRWPGRTTMTRRTLGSADDLKVFPLAEAREKAREQLRMARVEGVDPKVRQRELEAEQARLRRHTVRAVAEVWFEDKLAKERRGREARRDFENEFLPSWRDRPVTEIGPLDVLAVINAKKRTAPTQARNLLGLAKRFFQWAEDQQLYGLTASPCEKLKPSKIIGPKVVGERELSDDELLALLRATRPTPFYSIRRLSPPPHAAAYRMLLLTGLRLYEVADAEWSEFDPALVRALRQRDGDIDWRKFTTEQRTWRIPAARMKGQNGKAREHHVPLTSDMLATLERLGKPRGQFVFSVTGGRTSIWMDRRCKKRLDDIMLETLRALARVRRDPVAELRPWRNHDIRRTVRTGLSRLGVREEVGEAVLAHAPSGLRKTYNKNSFLGERREALELWGNHLRTLLRRSPPDNVVRLAARKRIGAPQWDDTNWPIGMSASGELNVVEDDGDYAIPTEENE
ncbi:MAG: integrase family protein [Xanthobacteraceae bacterium]